LGAQLEQLRKLGALVGWLSSSLAGVTALLYAMGFIATLAHLRVLGIGFEFASRDAFEYISRGGSAVWRGALFAVIPGVVLIFLWEPIRSLVARLRKRIDARPTLFGDIALVLLMAAFAAMGHYYALDPALDVTSLLFADDRAVCGYWADEVTKPIVTGDGTELTRSFGRVAFVAGIVESLAWLGARRMLRKGGSWILFSFYAVTAVFTFLAIPVAHGVFLDTRLRSIQLFGDTADYLTDDGSLRLLQHGDDGTLLWSESARKILWLRADTVQGFRLGAKTPLFPNLEAICRQVGGR
jgi:hypothetical protein